MLRIEYYRNALCGRRRFLEEFHPLGRHFIREERDPGEILAWPRERYGNFRTHGAIATTTDDRDSPLLASNGGLITSPPTASRISGFCATSSAASRAS